MAATSFLKNVVRRSGFISHSRSLSSKPLTVDNLNPHVKRMEYAVRGLIPIEAMRINDELKQVSVVT